MSSKRLPGDFSMPQNYSLQQLLVPIFMSGDPTQPSNYRPIALIYHIWKIITATIDRFILQNYFYTNQFCSGLSQEQNSLHPRLLSSYMVATAFLECWISRKLWTTWEVKTFRVAAKINCLTQPPQRGTICSSFQWLKSMGESAQIQRSLPWDSRKEILSAKLSLAFIETPSWKRWIQYL